MLLLLLSIGACATKQELPLTVDSVLTDWSLGPVRIGMTVDQIENAVGALDSQDIETFPEDSACYYIWQRDGPDGVSFMIVDGVLARIEISNPDMKTERGSKVGDSEADIMATYDNNVIVETRPYSGEPDHYLIVDSPGRIYSTLFETSNGKVEYFRAGQYDPVRWIEGCF
ncbi:MAG: hypothetical protein ACREEE_11595 [Dongiaceae bacterium]